MCTINDNQMTYGSWDMECNEHNFLSFENLSGTFTHLTNWKIKHLKKMKKKTLGDIITLHMCTINDNHPEIWSMTDIIFCHLDHFLSFYPTNNSKNKNVEKNGKNTRRYYHFTYMYHTWKSYDVWFLTYGAQRT